MDRDQQAERLALALARRMPGVVIAVGLCLAAPRGYSAVVATSFGPYGEAGEINGQTITFGETGRIFELDAFVSSGGLDLNGANPGSAARLSHGLPDLVREFSFSRAAHDFGLELTYELVLASSAPAGVEFCFFVDAEIDPDESYTDEFGVPSGVVGAPTAGPRSWEIDEPGFAFGDILANLLEGRLDNSNFGSAETPEDVSIALGFFSGPLQPSDAVQVKILLSDNGRARSAFSVSHRDLLRSNDVLTISGSLQVTPAPDADFDRSGAVDGSDFLLWQTTVGSAVNLSADANHDGSVDGHDLRVWESQLVAPTTAGDFNGDAAADGADFLLWQQGLGFGGHVADADRDGVVGGSDLAIWLNAYPALGERFAQRTGVIPEPSALAVVLGLAGAGSIMVRRLRQAANAVAAGR